MSNTKMEQYYAYSIYKDSEIRDILFRGLEITFNKEGIIYNKTKADILSRTFAKNDKVIEWEAFGKDLTEEERLNISSNIISFVLDHFSSDNLLVPLGAYYVAGGAD